MGNGSFYIYVERPEFARLSSSDDIVELVRRTADAPRDTYLEVFQGRESMLIFARAYEGAPTFYIFRDVEALIAAARVCVSDIITFLSYSEGVYYLIFYPWNREPPPAVLCEFGELTAEHREFARHLSEHGRVLLGPRALVELGEIFG
jgi:hypothetical protein